MSTAIVYGIRNCDTVKKARAFLDGLGRSVRFHDFKRDGVPREAALRWLETLGHEKLVNRQGTTWRKLDDARKALVTDAASALELMCAEPSVIKRPVVEWAGGEVTVGFSEEVFRKASGL